MVLEVQREDAMVLDAGVGPGGIGLVVQVIQGISKAILGDIKCVGYQEDLSSGGLLL